MRLTVASMIALVLWGPAGGARAEEPHEPSPLEAKLGFARTQGWTDQRPDPSRCSVGKLPVLELSVTNKGADDLEGEGPLTNSGFTLGLGSRIEIVGPDGNVSVFTPTLAECAPGERKPLAAGEKRNVGIDLSSYFALPAPGSYSVTVLLRDQRRRVAKSAPLTFDVVEPGPAPAGLALKIEARDPHRVEAIFSNNATKSWTVVLPQDGSEWGWVEPHYWFVVRDDTGRIVQPGSRCGNYGARYDEKSLVSLESKKTVSIPASLPQNLEGGRYTVTLHYIMTERPAKPGLGDYESDAPVKLPASADALLLGHVTSNEIVLDVPGFNRTAWLRGPIPDAVTKLVEELKKGDKEDNDVLQAVSRLKQLVGLGILSVEDQGRVRRAFIAYFEDEDRKGFSRGLAMEVLSELADESCLPVFRVAIYSGIEPEILGATVGMKEVLGRGGVVELVKELEKRRGKTVVPLLRAIAYYTNELETFNVPEGGNSYHEPRTEAEFADCKKRCLEWWRTQGKKWVEEK